MPKISRRALVFPFLLAACARAAQPTLAAAPAVRRAPTPLAVSVPAVTPKPTLVVFIAVDQMRPDYFARYLPQMTGGLGRLYRGGAFFSNAWQDHAITETAPGHSTMMSGRFPRSTGIVMNTAGVEDPQEPMIGGGGPGASPFRFRGTVLTDWLRVADPRTRALSVSRKDRGAILPLGRTHESVYWYASDGRFTTSTYYADTLPTWVNAFNARRIPQSFAGKSWDLLLPASAYPEPDSVPVENGDTNFVFPHRFSADPAMAAKQLVSTPMMDELTLAMALQGLQTLQLGNGPQTDVLSISLSTTDAIGHAFGPDSREIHDQVLRLDRYLGVFLDSLYRLRDSSRVVIALTADHAVAPYPQLHAKATGDTARFVNVKPLVRAMQQELAAVRVDSTAFHFAEGILYVDRPAFAAANVNADSVIAQFAVRARRIPGVERVDAVRDLASADTTHDDVARRWYHMLPPDVPAGAVVTLVPYAYWAGVTYATHGTPHDYDAHVPLLFYGPMIRPGVYDQRALVEDIAPTLAAILGVAPLERVDGQVLVNIVR